MDIDFARPIELAVVTETWPPEINGVALTLQRLIVEFGGRGHRVQLIRPRQSSDVGGGRRDPHSDTLLMPAMALPKYPGLQMGLPAPIAMTRVWRHRRPQIVHIATEGPLGWSALHAARRLDIPVTSDFRTRFEQYAGHYGLKLMGKSIERYLRRFHNRAALTFVPTRALRDELADIGFERLQVLGRGIDVNRFDPALRSRELRRTWGAADTDIVILFVGRLAPEKNIDRLLESFRTLRAAGLPVLLVMVGDGPSRHSLEQLDPAPILTGIKTGIDLARHYASSDLFAFPSLSETFGNVIPEALASGLPVVAYNRGAALELISDGIDGRTIDPQHPTGFTEALAALALDSDLRNRLGQRARARILDLSWESVALRFEASLLETLALRAA